MIRSGQDMAWHGTCADGVGIVQRHKNRIKMHIPVSVVLALNVFWQLCSVDSFFINTNHHGSALPFMGEGAALSMTYRQPLSSNQVTKSKVNQLKSFFMVSFYFVVFSRYPILVLHLIAFPGTSGFKSSVLSVHWCKCHRIAIQTSCCRRQWRIGRS